MKKALFLLIVMLLFAIFVSSVFAELIDGPANFRYKPNGKLLFSLNDKIEIESTEPIEGDWCYCHLYVYVKKNSITPDDQSVDKNVELYNSNGEIIGKTFDLIGISDYQEIDNTFRGCIIEGYTHKNNIRWETAIERDFEKVINNCSSEVIGYSYLNEFVKNRFFNNYGGNNQGYETLECSDSRIILIFYESNLAAILYKRKMTFQKFKSYKIVGLYNVIKLNNKLGDLESYIKNIALVSTQR